MNKNIGQKLWEMIRAFGISSVIFIIFSYGLIGLYHWPAFYIPQNIKNFLLDNNFIGHENYQDEKELLQFPFSHPLLPGLQIHIPIESLVLLGNYNIYQGEKELLKFAFKDPLIPGQQIHKPIKSFADIRKRNESILLPYENFFNAYNDIIITEASYLELNGTDRILKLNYNLRNMNFIAYSYCPKEELHQKISALIIPGSGINQSSKIYRETTTNYHFGIMEALGKSVDKYIFIKPNEDCLAFHNGVNKLSDDFIITWLLDLGASYSAHYIVNSLAITKYLKEKYNKVIVVGLSQGGEASLLNSLQSQPDIAIVSSGFSIINKEVTWSGYDQIIIPGLKQILSFETIRSKIENSNTQFLFTYGSQDIGTYKIEAIEKLTCKYFDNLENVHCKIHNGGHIFPRNIIYNFLRMMLLNY